MEENCEFVAISEMVQASAKVTIKHEFKLICDLSNVVISYDPV